MLNQPTRYNPAVIQPMERAPFMGMSISKVGDYVLYTNYAELEQRYLALLATKDKDGSVKE